MLPNEIESFTDYLKTRHYSLHTVANYELDLRLFFRLDRKAAVAGNLAQC